MKKVFAVLMSLQLIVAPVAMAQTAGDEFRSNPDAKPSTDYMEIIKSMTLGAVGVSSVQCTMAVRLPSIMLFAAGSLAYVAMELTAGKDQGDFLKRKAADIEMLEEKMKKSSGGAGEVQRATLEAALKDEQGILKIVNKKLSATKTVSTMLKVATAMAIVEAIMSKIPPYIFPDPAGCNAARMSPMQKMVGKGLSAAYGYTAMSGGGMIGGAATFGAAYVVSQGVVGGILSTMMNTALTRVAAFGIAATLTSTTSGRLSAIKSTVEGNIQKLQSVLNEFNNNTLVSNSTVQGQPTNSLTPGVVTSGAMGGSLGSSGSITNQAVSNVNPLANVGSEGTRNCWSNSSEGPNYTTDCTNPMRLARPNLGAEIQVPTLRDASTYSMDYAQAIASGDSEKANASAASLAALASKMDKVNSDLLSKLNDQRKKENLSAFDAEAEKSKLNDQLNSAIDSELKANGANIAALSKMNVLGAADKSLDQGKLDINSASSDVTASIPGNGSPTITEGVTNSEGTMSEGDVSNAPSMEETLSKYEDNQSDISDNPDESLFKQVSNRYMSNYSRFFKRKDVSEEPAPEPNK